MGPVMAVLFVAALACSEGRGGGVARGSAAPPARAAGDTASTSSSGSTSGGRRQLLFIGTSLTAGLGLDPDSAYPMLVQYRIDSAGLPFEVTNAGVSGETSAALLQRLDWLMRADFDVVVLETGANDGLRGIPVGAMRRNIAQVIGRIQQSHPNARIVLAQMEAPPNMGPQFTRDFHRVYPELADSLGVTLMPFLLDGVAGRSGLNQGDGIHPNIEGEHIVARNVWRTLEPMLRER